MKFTILDRWFRSDKEKQDYEEAMAAVEENRKSTEAIAKEKWETSNALAKKKDACNLGTTRLAFYGTYEEYKWSEQQRLMNLYSKAPLQQLLAQQSMNNPYNNYYSNANNSLSSLGSLLGF